MAMLLNASFAQTDPTLANIKDGEYNYQDNQQTLKVVIKDDSLEKFELNGVLIPEKDYPKYDDIINAMMNKLQQLQKAMNQNEKDRLAHEKKGNKGGDSKASIEFE